ncbi:protoporphyrinogen/coproporphyrinogen oxidase [Desulforhopalus singaporensis]|uniref:Oxygen-dependent protoporphyrinogen oxidase n=1 Tax=Desulforhopalus singaporensis TaxID=91360 RepID=A0A1H0N935_9BACT|nr:NAD(P)/FAD-dependent oxidoreductase [Desulforhopalus singaporensis]SDO88975.1 oxygen-dependent protoporphyrinogen oxidase [Desulforhopalus singaporensis]
MRDAIIVGGGLAGLTAAWYLRHRDVLVLESEKRFGGRVQSERRGSYWLNWGGHVYAGKNSATDDLLKSVGINSAPMPGTLKGLALNGKVLLSGSVDTYPFRVPLSWSTRLALVKPGLKIRMAVKKFGKAVERRHGEDYWSQQQRVYNFMNDKSFRDFVGELPEDADAFFKPTVSRSSGDPEQIAAGAGVGYFNLVWSKDNVEGGLTRYIQGGASNITDTIAASLKDRCLKEAVVQEVVQEDDSVTVRYTKDGVDHEERARYVVLATQAPISQKIAKNIDPGMSDALGKIKYGPYVSAAFLTNETGPQIWDNAYAIATPKRSFNVAFNMSNMVRASEAKGYREKGSSFMTFSPASFARVFEGKDNDYVVDTYLKDLDDIFPGFSKNVVEAKVMRWKLGVPFCFPGRAKLQPKLTRPSGRIYLAGDYLGTFYTETSIQTATTAAQHILSHLGTADQQG